MKEEWTVFCFCFKQTQALCHNTALYAQSTAGVNVCVLFLYYSSLSFPKPTVNPCVKCTTLGLVSEGVGVGGHSEVKVLRKKK